MTRSLVRPIAAGWDHAYLLLVTTMLLWAGNAIAGKLAAGVISPAELVFFRTLIASGLVYVVARRHVRRDLGALLDCWGRLFLLGALGFTAFNFLLYSALTHTTALNVTIELSCMPAVIMLMNFVAVRQRIHPLQLAGVTITIAGVLATVSQGSPETLLALDVNRGDAIMLLAVPIYAGYAVAVRFSPPVHSLSMMFAMLLGALVLAAVPWAWAGAHHGFALPGPAGWAVAIYTGVFAAVVSQVFFFRGVQLIGSNRAGTFINLVPIFSALLAVFVLGEAFRGYHLAGLVMVLGGIALAERFGR